MSDREVMQQALEALENSSPDQYPEDAGVFYDAITALKAALEQQAEPVAWDKPSDNFNDWWDGDYDDSANRFEKDSAAYWAWAGWQAAQRQWVGLTDEESTELDMEISGRTMDECVRAIEAKLKEKNDR